MPDTEEALTDTQAPRGSQRPGGRTERTRQAVAQAVLDLLNAGVTDFTVRDVAAQSGVARSTIYARWPGKDALISEALTLHSLAFQVTPGRTWPETLRNFAYAFRDFSTHPTEVTLNRLTAYMESSHLASETRRIWGQITSNLGTTLEEAQCRGEIRPDITPRNILISLMTSISGMVVMAKRVPDDRFIEELVQIHVTGSATPTTNTSLNEVPKER